MSKRKFDWGAIQGWGKKNIRDGTFDNFGAWAGGMAGGPLGSEVGSLAGKTIAKLVGFGDYDISMNTLAGTMPTGIQVPSFGDLSKGTRIQHREYIQDIIIPATPGNFTLTQFNINPGNANLYPWLSSVARMYQEYSLLGCVIEYKSTASDSTGSSTNLALGSVIMATDYNTLDTTYGSKPQMEQSQFCVSGKPSTDIMHPIECDPSVTRGAIKFIRPNAGGIPATANPNDYDMGSFQIATQGLPSGTTGNIGELWITYDVLLLKPFFNANTITFDRFVSTSGVTASNYLAPTTTTTIIPVPGSTLGGSCNTSTYTFPVNAPGGIYKINASWLGVSTTLTTAVTFTLSSNLAAILNPATRFCLTAGAIAANQFAEMQVTLTPTGTAATILVASGTLPATFSKLEFEVSLYPQFIAT